MWEFISTVFFLWCLWSVFVWLRDRRRQGRAMRALVREQKAKDKAAREEQERMDKVMKEYKAKRERELKALGLDDWSPGARMRKVPFEKVARWEGGAVRRLIYTPVLAELDMRAEFFRDAAKGYKVRKGDRMEGVWLSHADYGSVVVVAPESGVWVPLLQEGERPKPGDALLELDTTPEALMLWEEAEAAERAERIRQAQEREKAEIAAKLKARQSRRQLEEQVRMELIDSGELFGDQPKRPPIPREVVDAVYRRDGARCVYCGSTENLQLDHIIPFSKGGATSLENLQLLCQKCNLEKSNKIG